MIIEYLLLSLTGVIVGFSTIMWFIISITRFLSGDIKKFVSNILVGIIFLYFSVVTSSVIEFYGLNGTILEVPKYAFIIIGFAAFYMASLKLDEISKVLGFNPEVAPKKLKKILK